MKKQILEVLEAYISYKNTYGSNQKGDAHDLLYTKIRNLVKLAAKSDPIFESVMRREFKSSPHCNKCGCTELLCGHNKRG